MSGELGRQLAQPHRDEDDDRVRNLRVLCCGLLCGASNGALGDSTMDAAFAFCTSP
jgi:hypothetical protein